MSNKYTASKQGRAHGGYARRLAARGLNKAPSMTPYTDKSLEAARRRDERAELAKLPA